MRKGNRRAKRLALLTALCLCAALLPGRGAALEREDAALRQAEALAAAWLAQTPDPAGRLRAGEESPCAAAAPAAARMEREAAFAALEERLALRLTGRETAVTIQNGETRRLADGSVAVTAYVLTTCRYDDLRDGPGGEDAFAFGTWHRLVLSPAGEIRQDEYDEEDLFGGPAEESAEPFAAFAAPAAPLAAPSLGYYEAYDPTAAIAYADRYWQEYNPAYYNFNSVGGDCANFTSQSIFAGGMPQVVGSQYGTNGWFYRSSTDRSATWTGARQLRDWMGKNRGRLVTASDSTVFPGSPVFYADAHAVICVGYNSAGRPVIDSHNRDRYHVPWDYYETDSTTTVQLTKTAEVVDPGPGPGPDPPPDPPPVTPGAVTLAAGKTLLQAGESFPLSCSFESGRRCTLTVTDAVTGELAAAQLLSAPETLTLTIEDSGRYLALAKLDDGSASEPVELIVTEDLGPELWASLCFSASETLLQTGEDGMAASAPAGEDPRQIWRLLRGRDGGYELLNVYDGAVLTALGTEAGAALALVERDGSARQRWYVYRAGGSLCLQAGFRRLLLERRESGEICLGAPEEAGGRLLRVEAVDYAEPPPPAVPLLSAPAKLYAGEPFTLSWTEAKPRGRWDQRTYRLLLRNGAGRELLRLEGLETTEAELTLPREGRFVVTVTAVNACYPALETASQPLWVQADPAPAPGDVNGDGAVNDRDVLLLFRSQACGGPPILRSAADADGDGALTAADAAALFRRVSGCE